MAPTPTISVRPIRTERDYEDALAEVAALMRAESGTPEGDRLDVLTTLIEAYEARHHAIGSADPIEAIRFRMDQQGMTNADLRPILGSRGRVSEILLRRRPLTLAMIRRLVDLGIPADVLIRPTGAPSAAPAPQRGAEASKSRRTDGRRTRR